MIVTCENCSTQFQLDDSKIPEAGIQVQCSRCEHVFDVGPEAHPEADSPEGLAVDALLSGAQDDAANGDAESDWEFNDDGVIADSLDEGDLEEAPPEAAAEPSIAEEAVDDLLGSIGDTEALDDGGFDDAELEIDDSLGELDLEFDAAEAEIAADEEEREVPEIEAAPVAELGEDLSDPDNWDIFDKPSETPVPEFESAPPAASDRATRADSEAVGRSEPAVEISVPLEVVDSAAPHWALRARAAAGWAVVAALLLMGLHSGLTSRSDGLQSSPGQWAGGGFEADQIEGRWVDNGVAGPIYVVSGRLRRVAGSQPSSGTRLEISLIDARGRTIDWGPAPLGPAIPNRILRESSPAELERRQAQRAARLAAGADSWRPFEAVLAPLPGTANRFQLAPSTPNPAS